MRVMPLSEQQIMLLAVGIKNKGILRADQAYSLYSSRESAHESLVKLKFLGYIDPIGIGVFRVNEAPDEAFILAEKMK